MDKLDASSKPRSHVFGGFQFQVSRSVPEWWRAGGCSGLCVQKASRFIDRWNLLALLSLTRLWVSVSSTFVGGSKRWSPLMSSVCLRCIKEHEMNVVWWSQRSSSHGQTNAYNICSFQKIVPWSLCFLFLPRLIRNIYASIFKKNGKNISLISTLYFKLLVVLTFLDS